MKFSLYDLNGKDCGKLIGHIETDGNSVSEFFDLLAPHITKIDKDQYILQSVFIDGDGVGACESVMK